MQRRHFIGNLLAAGSALAFQTPDSSAPDPSIKRVLFMSKCHLDVGFIDTQAKVIKKYFEVYFPRAIETAAALRRAGNDRYVWTTGSWLTYQYIEKAGATQRQQMEQAIAT